VGHGEISLLIHGVGLGWPVGFLADPLQIADDQFLRLE
jgi:hypothetical protein